MKQFIFFTTLAIVSLAGLAVYQYFRFHDGKLHVVFCDVGQGDAIFITTPNNKHLLVDSGPDASVVNCLSEHLPFWDRTIDLALLTHPHNDHFAGLPAVLQNFTIASFATEKLANNTDGYKLVKQLLNEKQIPQRFVAQGDQWRVGDTTLKVIGPSTEYLIAKSPNGNITDTKEFASLITEISYGKARLVLTGDSQTAELAETIQGSSSPLSVLQMPHHGSRTGIDGDVLEKLHPHLAVISVGAYNRYGHPSKQTLSLLAEQQIPYLRTDKGGDVEIVSDGKTVVVSR